MGQTTAQQIGNAGQNMATSVGNDITNSAAARASGYVGGANALTGGLSQYLNYTNNQNIANALATRNLSSPTGYGTRIPGDYSSVTG
jgi:hypothetical protein